MKEPQVYLVGAGPGDPDLLTVKAQRLIQCAQNIVYDRLVSKEILKLIPASCSQVYVGKSPGRHTLAQEEINRLLVNMAQNGQSVVRLKGGDPGIFGRVGEEAQALGDCHIRYEIVPGITAAQACAAELGIALTHRDYAPKLNFISGQRKPGQECRFDEAELINPRQTLVVYMGMASAQTLSRQLLEIGRARSTPVAIVERVSMPEQRIVFSTLAGLPAAIEDYQIKSPALIVISPVVAHCQGYQFEVEVAQMASRKLA